MFGLLIIAIISAYPLTSDSALTKLYKEFATSILCILMRRFLTVIIYIHFVSSDHRNYFTKEIVFFVQISLTFFVKYFDDDDVHHQQRFRVPYQKGKTGPCNLDAAVRPSACLYATGLYFINRDS